MRTEERMRKSPIKVMVFCNTPDTWLSTNNHDMVVDSSRANHSTLTDDCSDGIKHSTPVLVSSPVFLTSCSFFSPAHLNHCFLSIFFQLLHFHHAIDVHTIFSFFFISFLNYFCLSYNSMCLSLLTFTLDLTPFVNTSSSTSEWWFDKEVDGWSGFVMLVHTTLIDKKEAQQSYYSSHIIACLRSFYLQAV